MNVTILYFAAVRELVGIDEEAVELPPNVTTIAQLAACAEGLSAMGRARHADDRGVADLERSDAVDRADADAVDFALDLVCDTLHFALRHRGVGGVLELRHRATDVLVADDTEKHRD